MAKMKSSSRRQQPSTAAVLVVLILALAVQGTSGQVLWDKLPLLGRFSKAAQAAKAAAAAITVHAPPPSSQSLPPAPATPVAPAASQPPPAPAEQAAAPAEAKHKWGKKGGKAGKKLGTTGKNDTQAGCSCLAEWEARPGGPRLSGCSNPDNDPLGPWCPVDPNECMGYYSMYRTEKGKLRFFDYCVPVRERTKRGCLCSGDWNPGEAAVGKAHYRDGCARPHSPQGSRVCKVDSATCPPGVEVDGFDECVDKPEQMVNTRDKTWHNCGCVQGWNYKYEDGTSAIFSTCANPDMDPLGAWCEVDPTKCDSFSTILKNGNQKMSIDYCQSKFKTPEPSDCQSRLKLFDQCGGKSNCTHSGCLNAPWPGACCPRGSECRYQDAFYYQCLPLDTDMSVKSYKTAPAAGGSPTPPKSTHTPPPPPPKKSTPTPPPAAFLTPPAPPAEEAVQEIALSSLEEVVVPPSEGSSAAAEGGGAVREAGSRVWVKLRLGMDYDLLVAQPQRLAAFKSDIAHWLREVVGDTKYIYGTGVDEVVSGSVVAVAYVDFTKDAPAAAVDAAMEQLHTTGQNMFAESQLPQKWGWVLNYNMGQNKTDLMQDNPGDVQIQSMNFPPGNPKPAPRRRPSQLSLTAAVAIAVAGLIILLGLVCAAIAYRRRAARRLAKAKPTKTGKDNGGQHGGIGGTHSGYLADLDGMDDGMSEKMTKKSFGRSSMFNSAESTLARVGQGLKGVLRNPSSRHALKMEAGSAMDAAAAAAAKRPSESGATSRLWNWLQKAETPSSDDNAGNSALSSPEVSCSISARGSGPKESPRPGGLLLPSPRNPPLPLPALDLSDPGGAFRVPPPSPRYTERAHCPMGASPAEAAAAAVAAVTAAAALSGSNAAAAGSNAAAAGSNNVMLSPRPAPAQAALLSGGAPKNVISFADRRAAAAPSPMAPSRPAAPPPPPMASPRPMPTGVSGAPGSSPHHHHSHHQAMGQQQPGCVDGSGGVVYTPLDSITSNTSGYGTAASEFSTPYSSASMPDLRQAQPKGGGGGGPQPYGMRSSSSNAIPADVGELPPGISMGPFLRAAIKSLTGQSLGDSPYNSEGGNPAPAQAQPSSYHTAGGGGGGGMYGGGHSHSTAQHSTRGPSPVGAGSGGASHPGYGGHTYQGPGGGGGGGFGKGSGPPMRQGSGPVVGADAVAAAVRASAQAAAEQDAQADEQAFAGSGSVFQSLWMQRLVAAAQAQQADEAQQQQQQHNMYNMR